MEEHKCCAVPWTLVAQDSWKILQNYWNNASELDSKSEIEFSWSFINENRYIIFIFSYSQVLTNVVENIKETYFWCSNLNVNNNKSSDGLSPANGPAVPPTKVIASKSETRAVLVGADVTLDT